MANVRSVRRRRGIVLTLVLGAFLVLFVPATPASAGALECPQNPLDCTVPGFGSGDVDCKEAPAPSRPDSGLAGWFLSEPKNPSTADPFAPNAKVSTYDVYGYAGLDYITYDLGCGGTARNPEAVTMNTIANLVATPAMWLVALDNSVREYAYRPNSMWGWTNDLVQRASDALRDRVFSVWGAVVLALVGLWLLWGARGGNMSAAVVTAGWAVFVMALVTAVAAWPVKASTVADNTLTGALGQVTSVLAQDDPNDDREPAVRASGVLTETVLYKQWLRGTLGSADSETAVTYGPDLYKARSISWAEAEEMEKSADRRKEILGEKAKLWTATAEKVKDEDPDAYEYLVGRKGSEKVGSALLAFISALVVTPFDIMASLLILIAFLIIRLAVAFLPAIGTVAILRPASGPLRGLLRTVVAAMINCVIFGCGSALFLLAVEVITGTNSLAGWQQILLIWLTGLILWLLLRPYRRLTHLTGVDPFGELAGGLGRMHKKVFGDMKQLAVGAAGTYLGDVAALEANDRRRAEEGKTSRPETWSRDTAAAPAGARTADAPGADRRRGRQSGPGGDPLPAGAGARSGAAAGQPGAPARPETRSGPKRTDEVVVVPARTGPPGQAPARENPGSAPVNPAPQPATAEHGIAEDHEVRVVYRPDRGYTPVQSAEERSRLSHTAANVARTANAVRDVAVATSNLAKAESERHRT